MAKIHELIPVEADKMAAANALTDEAINTFTKKPELFTGHSRLVTMYDEARQAENSKDYKEVIESVPSKLAHVWDALVPAIDVQAAKENSNTSDKARADVSVNGKTVLKDIPATALLALEKRLAQLRNLYSSIPTLDPTFAWEPDPNAALEGIYRTKYPTESQKTEKVHDYKVMVQATDKHPAQVAEYTIDKNVAKVSVDRQSGMVSPAQKARWLKRINDLATAVKEARQRANMADVKPLDVAANIREYIHA